MQTGVGRIVTFGWLVVAAATFATSAHADEPAATTSLAQESTLHGLDEQLNRTGRFATVPVTTVGEITPAERTRGGRAEARVRRVQANSSGKDAAPPNTAALGDYQYNKALTAAEECHLDVARRRGVVPQNVPAGSMTIRWTIEATGVVRDAEALSVSGTDPEVAACAKRILTGWHFIRPTGGQVVVERTLTFRPLP
ncbi:MAG TPA: hypothetical protein VFH73_27910 [Polyangia bacterium]|nr:hypothetical protein [Polyangia bacterium]